MYWIPIFWFYYSTCFGQPFCPSSGVLSRTSALVHLLQLWSFATRSRMERHFHPTPGSKRSQLHQVYQSRCTAKNSWWWTERLPETYRVVIPIKLEFSTSVGFIHKEPSGWFLFRWRLKFPLNDNQKDHLMGLFLVLRFYQSLGTSVLSEYHWQRNVANGTTIKYQITMFGILWRHKTRVGQRHNSYI